MKVPDASDYLLNQVNLISEEHGELTCSFVSVEGDEEVSTLKASGEYGSIVFQETRYEDFSIGQATYNLEQDMNLTVDIHSNYTGLYFALKNDIRYEIEGLPKGVITKHWYNLVSIPNARYKQTFRKNEEYVLFSIHFTNVYLDRWKEPFPLLLELLNKARLNIPAVLSEANLSATPEMLAVIQSILHCNYTGKLKKMYLQAKVLELLMLSLQHTTPADFKGKLALRQTDIKKIQEAREYLVEHMECPCSLRELAHRVGINVFKLKCGFKQLYGNTVFGVLLDERMAKAKKLLMETDMFINEISSITGYKNLSNFTAAFKKKFGYPPSAIKPGVL